MLNAAQAVANRLLMHLDQIIDEAERATETQVLQDLYVSLAAKVARLSVCLFVASSPPTDRMLTVKQATRQFPVSRSFLYERGESLGLLTRPTGLRGPRCSERALREWLQRR